MTELSFLIDLLINPRDQEQLKKDLADRIKFIEQNYTSLTTSNRPGAVNIFNGGVQQAPSTAAAMARHEANPMPLNEVPAVQVIAQNPVTAAALEANAAIKNGIKPPMTRDGRPRKF